MKKNLTIILLLLSALSVFPQKPLWIIDSNYYPKTEYLAGFAVNEGTETPAFIKALKASAKSELIESIKVQVSSAKELRKSEQNGIYSEDYTATTASFANAEINGLKIEYYYDKAAQTGYALAFANKNEVKGWYKANISFILQKIETALSDAQQFETQGNKGKAKRTYEEILPLFDELHFSQSLLIAIEGDEYAQISKTLEYKSAANQAILRMQTAIRVFVQSKETNFGKPVNILAPKLKAELSEHGCSFTNRQGEADWILKINASTRKGSEIDRIYFSFLDVEISLIELRSKKEIYSNNFTGIKSGALNYERAGRKAYDTGIKEITKEIVANIEK